MIEWRPQRRVPNRCAGSPPPLAARTAALLPRTGHPSARSPARSSGRSATSAGSRLLRGGRPSTRRAPSACSSCCARLRRSGYGGASPRGVRSRTAHTPTRRAPSPAATASVRNRAAGSTPCEPRALGLFSRAIFAGAAAWSSHGEPARVFSSAPQFSRCQGGGREQAVSVSCPHADRAARPPSHPGAISVSAENPADRLARSRHRRRSAPKGRQP